MAAGKAGRGQVRVPDGRLGRHDQVQLDDARICRLKAEAIAGRAGQSPEAGQQERVLGDPGPHRRDRLDRLQPDARQGAAPTRCACSSTSRGVALNRMATIPVRARPSPPSTTRPATAARRIAASWWWCRPKLSRQFSAAPLDELPGGGRSLLFRRRSSRAELVSCPTAFRPRPGSGPSPAAATAIDGAIKKAVSCRRRPMWYPRRRRHGAVVVDEFDIGPIAGAGRLMPRTSMGLEQARQVLFDRYGAFPCRPIYHPQLRPAETSRA